MAPLDGSIWVHPDLFHAYRYSVTSEIPLTVDEEENEAELDPR